MTSNNGHTLDVTHVAKSLQNIALAVVKASSSGNLDSILQEIAHTASLLVGARYSALGIPDGRGSFRHFHVSGITAEEFSRVPHPPVGKGLLGMIMRDRSAIRISHIAEHPESAGFPPYHPDMTTLLGVPIQIGQHLFGLLYLSDKYDGEPFNAEDQNLIETLASYAALAIAGVQLSQQQSQLSILEERERIAMAMHDSVIQSLYAIGMELQLLKLDLGNNAQLDSPLQHLDNVIAEIREHIMKLKSAQSQRMTIRAGLVATLDRLHIPQAMRVYIDAPDDYPPLDTPTFDAVCMIASEVTSNAVRHANATELHISARKDARSFILQIEDNGEGFDMQEARDGLGLSNIYRRAELHGGQLDLRSSQGHGTCVRLILPMR